MTVLIDINASEYVVRVSDGEVVETLQEDFDTDLVEGVSDAMLLRRFNNPPIIAIPEEDLLVGGITNSGAVDSNTHDSLQTINKRLSDIVPLSTERVAADEPVGDTVTVNRSGTSPLRESAKTSKYAKFDANEWVTYGANDTTNLVLGVFTSPFEWFVGGGPDGPDQDPEFEEIEASKDRVAYIVAKQNGGSAPYWESELSETDEPDEEVDLDEASNAEPKQLYSLVSDPNDLGQVQAVCRSLAAQHNDPLYNYTTPAKLENTIAPGVENPWVGFRPGKPDGWTRISYLRAYASLGGSWTTCNARMTGRIRSPKRWCSSLKDEIMGHEYWRNRY